MSTTTPTPPTGYSLTKITSLPGHTDRVWHCAWSPGGTALATCSSDKTIRVWKKASRLGSQIVTDDDIKDKSNVYGTLYPQTVLDGLLENTLNSSLVETAFQFTQQQQENQNGEENGQDIIINKNDWECLQVLEDVHLRTIRSIAWSPSGRHIAAASFDHSVSIWELIDGKFELIATLRGHENEVKAVAWNQSGELLATCSRDKTIWIWENDGVDNWECTSVLTGHAGDVKKVAFHPHTDDVISVSYDDTLRVWQTQDDDWYNVITLADSTSTVWDFAFTKNSKFLCTTSDDLHLRVYFNDLTQPLPKQWKYLIDSKIAQRPIFSVSTSNQFFPPKTITTTIPNDDELSCQYSLYKDIDTETYYVGLAPCFGYISVGTGDNNIGIYEFIRQIPTTQLKHVQFDLSVAVPINTNQISFTRQLKQQQPIELVGQIIDAQDSTPTTTTSDEKNETTTTVTNTTTSTPIQHTRDVVDPLYNQIDGLINVLTVKNAHVADVNCVAWNPKIGNILASVGDDNQVHLWRFTKD